MGCPTDRATELEQMHRESALKACKSVHVQPTDDCIKCGLQISSERQIATGGTDTCISCANKNEAKNKAYRQ